MAVEEADDGDLDALVEARLAEGSALRDWITEPAEDPVGAARIHVTYQVHLVHRTGVLLRSSSSAVGGTTRPIDPEVAMAINTDRFLGVPLRQVSGRLIPAGLPPGCLERVFLLGNAIDALHPPREAMLLSIRPEARLAESGELWNAWLERTAHLPNFVVTLDGEEGRPLIDLGFRHKAALPPRKGLPAVHAWIREPSTPPGRATR